jgi:hypothetical protein
MNRTKALLPSAAPRQRGRTAAAVVFVAMCQTVLQGDAPARARLRVFRVLSNAGRATNAHAGFTSQPACHVLWVLHRRNARASSMPWMHTHGLARASVDAPPSEHTQQRTAEHDGLRTCVVQLRRRISRTCACVPCVRAAWTREGV